MCAHYLVSLLFFRCCCCWWCACLACWPFKLPLFCCNSVGCFQLFCWCCWWWRWFHRNSLYYITRCHVECAYFFLRYSLSPILFTLFSVHFAYRCVRVVSNVSPVVLCYSFSIASIAGCIVCTKGNYATHSKMLLRRALSLQIDQQSAAFCIIMHMRHPIIPTISLWLIFPPLILLISAIENENFFIATFKSHLALNYISHVFWCRIALFYLMDKFISFKINPANSSIFTNRFVSAVQLICASNSPINKTSKKKRNSNHLLRFILIRRMYFCTLLIFALVIEFNGAFFVVI